MSTFTVTNANDTGTGSLRQAIISSNATSGTTPNTIKFAINSGVQTIRPKSALPTITHAVLIDGTTQPGTGTTPRIALDGTSAGSVVGLTLTASNVTVKGLAIDAFAAGGVLVRGASNNLITNDFIGVTPSGTVAKGNGTFGVELINSATNNVVSNDVISGSLGNGVVISGVGTRNNVVSGSMIGTDVTGTVSLTPQGNGVVINLGAMYNTIGGTTASARNVISGQSSANGVVIENAGTARNVVSGDFIGTDVTGTKPLPNLASAVVINQGASGNTVGGLTTGARDLISGNGFAGVFITDNTTVGNAIIGDFIGTDVTGTKALGNGANGVLITGGSSGNTIGGTPVGARNVISGQTTSNGVAFSGAGTNSNLLFGNFIGTDVTGTKAVPNNNGVLINLGSSFNAIGGTIAGARNLISGNRSDGVQIDNFGTITNSVNGNFIGTDVTGLNALANGRAGVYLWAGTSANIIGGSGTGAGNVISGNAAQGVIIDAASSNNFVQGNTIGLKAGGEGILPNGGDGVFINNLSTNNTIGGSVFGAQNLISGNKGNGVRISNSNGNTVAGNYIGIDKTGNFDQGNALDGVRIEVGSSGNTIGGGVQGFSRNVISANGHNGVDIDGSNANIVLQNYIGTVASGAGPLGNHYYGVYMAFGSTNNTIGSTNLNFLNMIENNLDGGLYISGAVNTTIEGNIIVLNGQNSPVSILGDGIYIVDSLSTFVTMCTIQANRDWGILMVGSPSSVLLNNNFGGNGLGDVQSM